MLLLVSQIDIDLTYCEVSLCNGKNYEIRKQGSCLGRVGRMEQNVPVAWVPRVGVGRGANVRKSPILCRGEIKI